MMMRRGVLLSLFAGLLLAGCSSSPQPTAKSKGAPKPPEPVTGQTAFWKMYTTAARTWAPDAQALEMRNIPIPEVKGGEGKFGAWQAIFVSQSKGQQRTYTYSVVESSGMPRDVFPQVAESWSGPRGQQRPWPVQAFKVDSDKAYEAAAKESAEYMKKNPNKPVNFLLEQTSRHPELAWRVIWGESVPTSNYSVYVSASTGQFLEKMR